LLGADRNESSGLPVCPGTRTMVAVAVDTRADRA
jgi:hypothetical protein